MAAKAGQGTIEGIKASGHTPRTIGHQLLQRIGGRDSREPVWGPALVTSERQHHATADRELSTYGAEADRNSKRRGRVRCGSPWPTEQLKLWAFQHTQMCRPRSKRDGGNSVRACEGGLDDCPREWPDCSVLWWGIASSKAGRQHEMGCGGAWSLSIDGPKVGGGSAESWRNLRNFVWLFFSAKCATGQVACRVHVRDLNGAPPPLLSHPLRRGCDEGKGAQVTVPPHTPGNHRLSGKNLGSE